MLVIGVADQRMVVLDRGTPLAVYPVSTSKFGLGDGFGSYRTPMGTMKIRQKIGTGIPPGGVLKSRRFTGEILPVDRSRPRPDCHPHSLARWHAVVQSRRLRALHLHPRHAEERNIGKPASYGCIRMRSRDVIALYDLVGVGARVKIIPSLEPAFAGQELVNDAQLRNLSPFPQQPVADTRHRVLISWAVPQILFPTG